MNDMAKVFWRGRSQAVALPDEYRVGGTEMKISRDGDKIVLEPVDDGGEWIERMAGTFDEDFARAVLEGHLGPEHMPDGPNFD